MLTIRPFVSIIRWTVTFVSSKFNTQSHGRSIATYEATVSAGMELVAKDEIKSKFHTDVQIMKGRVIFKTDSHLKEILKLRSVNNLFVLIFEETLRDDDMPTDPKSLERVLFRIGDQSDWKTGLEKWLEMSSFDCNLATLMTKDPELKDRQPKFRISSKRFGYEHKFTSPELCSLFGHVVDLKFGWPIRMKGMDLDIYLNFDENRVTVSITLTPICLAYRNIRTAGLTTLKATTCYAMLRTANIQKADIVVDPMAGSGAIPLECCDCYHNEEFMAMTIGGEIRKQTLRNCRNNAEFFLKERTPKPPLDLLRLNVTSLPFCDNIVDVFISDLPFGQRHGSKEINQKLYPALLREMGRVARLSTGRAVLLTHDYKNLISAYKQNTDLWIELSDDMIRVGNLKCFIYLYQRTSNPFVIK